MVRFIHTSDWQLGMTRHFFPEGPQERYDQARFDAIRKIGQVATTEKCQFVVVCGDIFESNQVDNKTIARAFEALKKINVPVYILPGNHDPLNEVSVYKRTFFSNAKPDNVHIIVDSNPILTVDEVKIVGTPWLSKNMDRNPIYGVIGDKVKDNNDIRILLAHGIVDDYTPQKESPGIINASDLELIIRDKQVSYIALGDRHSYTELRSNDRIWYSGTTEVTDFNETSSGYVLVVELGENNINVKPIQIGEWKFIKLERQVNTEDDIRSIATELEQIESKERSVVKLNLVGSISLNQEILLDQVLEVPRQVFASLQIEKGDLIVVPENTDFSHLGLTGFAEDTVDRLLEIIENRDTDQEVAHDALMLLIRLNGDA